MHDLGGGCEENRPTSRTDRRAEVDVLRVQEETFVEQADRFRIRAIDEQARTADPIDELFAAGETREQARLAEHLLPQLVEWRDHPSEGHLGSPVAVDEARP